MLLKDVLLNVMNAPLGVVERRRDHPLAIREVVLVGVALMVLALQKALEVEAPLEVEANQVQALEAEARSLVRA